MIKRIVKMSFQPDKVEAFKQIFRTNWEHIKNFEGCEHVELLQVEAEPTVFFTYSRWRSESHLELYRQSKLFEGVWSETRKLFNDKPQAWTVKELKF